MVFEVSEATTSSHLLDIQIAAGSSDRIVIITNASEIMDFIVRTKRTYNKEGSKRIELCEECSNCVKKQLSIGRSKVMDTNDGEAASSSAADRQIEGNQHKGEVRFESVGFLPVDDVLDAENAEQMVGQNFCRKQEQDRDHVPSPSQEEEEDQPAALNSQQTINLSSDRSAENTEAEMVEQQGLHGTGTTDPDQTTSSPTENHFEQNPHNEQREKSDLVGRDVEMLDSALAQIESSEQQQQTDKAALNEPQHRQEQEGQHDEVAHQQQIESTTNEQQHRQEGQQQDEVIEDPDEAVRRSFGFTSRIEIPLSARAFNKIVENLGYPVKRRRNREESDEDDSDAEIRRQLKSGKNFLNRFGKKKLRKTTEDQPDEIAESVEDSEGQEGEHVDDCGTHGENGGQNEDEGPATSNQTAKKRKRPGPKSSKRTTAGKKDGDEENGEWLSKSDASNRKSSGQAEEADEQIHDKMDDDSGKESSESGQIPAPKITRAMHKKNQELANLFRRANRAMLDEDDEESDQNGEGGDTDEKKEDHHRKSPSKAKERRGASRLLSSSSSEIVLSSGEESSQSSIDSDYSGNKKKAGRKASDDGYPVIKLSGNKRGPKAKAATAKKNIQGKKEKKKTQKEKPSKRKGRKNTYMLSDDDDEDGEGADRTTDAEDEAVGSTDEEVPKKSSTRKVIPKKDLAVETKEAERAEKERRKRLEERQREFNGIELVTDESSNSTTLVYTGEGSQPLLKSIMLDRDSGSEAPMPVQVHLSLTRVLKKHQAEGIKFLYDCTIESLARLEEEGGGAILGHCMGLGKTLQIIAFLHTILSHPRISEKIHKVLIFAPKNVLLNWVNEFEKWLYDNDPELDNVINYTEIGSLTDNNDRLQSIKKWVKRKGPSVLIIGYEMYRLLTESEEDRPKPKRSKKPPKPKQLSKKAKELERLKPQLRNYLFEGPHLVICDEGHKLKNCETAISKTINRIHTKRRICLTGTPLQNNLSEYYCMVNFVKPNLLGNMMEFKNRFESIIDLGKTVDATRHQVLCMRRRCHVLHDRLKGILERRDYTVLKQSLPPKQEYVIMVRLTLPQIDLYRQFLQFIQPVDERKGTLLLGDHIILYRVWTHPYLIIEHEREAERKQLMKDEEELDDGFVVRDSEMEETSAEENGDDEITAIENDRPASTSSAADRPSTSTKPTQRVLRSNKEVVLDDDDRVETPFELKEWAKDLVSENDRNNFALSNKLFLLTETIKKCEAIGDKLLVFSQFLNSIALIQRMLAYYAAKDEWFVDGHKALMRKGEQWLWKKGRDYDVIDGAVSAKDRDRIQHEFNDPLNLRKRLLLISTRAGSLGINLIGANRVIIFDCCWNPSHDTQSLFRVYRFGQKKPVYIYRFVAQGTMEERVYNRQVTKESTAKRVTEAAQIQRHYKVVDLKEMYRFEPAPPVTDQSQGPQLDPPKDRLLGDIILSGTDAIVSYHPHDMLFNELEDEELTPDDREEAWREYEREMQPRPPPLPMPMPSSSAEPLVGTTANIQSGASSSFTNITTAHQLQMLMMIQQQQKSQQQQQQQQHIPQIMGQLMSSYNTDEIYRLCFKVPGMQPSTAMQIFQIKQFLCYFIHLIPKEDLGEMNNGEAFNAYFTNIVQQAIEYKESQESVQQKIMITLATTISLAQRHAKCQAAIDFILQMFPTVREHLDQTQ